MSEGQSSLLAELAELRDENGAPPMKSRDMMPCPFCNSHATMTHGQYYYVECSNSGHCHARTRVFTFEADAIKAWNTRAAAPAPAPDMREAIDRAIETVENDARVLIPDNEVLALLETILAAIVPPPAIDLDKPTLPLPLTSEQRLSTDDAQFARDARDWPEDAAHENGNYECRCFKCEKMFIGHKRRVICKVCATDGRGEPVAWHFEWKPSTNDNAWQHYVSLKYPRFPGRLYRKIRPLTFAALPPAGDQDAVVEERSDLINIADEIVINRRIGAQQLFSEDEAVLIEKALRAAAIRTRGDDQ